MNITREPCESAGCSRNVSFEFRKGTCVVPDYPYPYSEYPYPYPDYPMQC